VGGARIGPRDAPERQGAVDRSGAASAADEGGAGRGGSTGSGALGHTVRGRRPGTDVRWRDGAGSANVGWGGRRHDR
jgi:hypothetical protein